MKPSVLTRCLVVAALALGFGLAGSAPAAAFPPPPEEVVLVLPEIHPHFPFTLQPWSTPSPSGVTLIKHTAPALGDLDAAAAPGNFVYHPGPDFWSLGFDSFTYTYDPFRSEGQTTDGPVTVRVLLVAAAHGVPTFEDGFVSGDYLAWDQVVNPESLVINSQAAIHGPLGLEVKAAQPGYPRPAYLALSEVTARGGDPDLGCGHVQVDVSATPPPVGDDGPVMWFFEGGRSGGGFHSRIGLRFNQGSFQLRVKGTHADGSTVATPWKPLAGAGPWRVDIDWWNESAEHSAGLLAQVDSEFIGRLDDLVNPGFGELSELRFGLNNNVASTPINLYLDNIRVFSGDPAAVHGAMHSDGFEDNLAAWRIGGDANAVWVRDTAAITGRSGLLVNLLGTVPGYLEDASPSAARHYGYRMKVLATKANLNTDGPQLFFAASALEGGPEVTSLGSLQAINDHLIEAWVEPDWSSATPNLVVRVQLDDGTYATLGGFPLSSVDRVVDIQWWAAVEDGSNDGRLRLFVDGVLVGELRGLDNDARSIEANYLGRLSSLPAMARHAPVLVIDDFESWR